jgi:hypothetical protein
VYPSPRGTFNVENFKRWGLGSLIAGASAAIAYSITHVADLQTGGAIEGVLTVALTALGQYVQHLWDGPIQEDSK